VVAHKPSPAPPLQEVDSDEARRFVAATLSIGLGLLLCRDWRKIAPSVAEMKASFEYSVVKSPSVGGPASTRGNANETS
jgi:hypothetical protein